MNRKVRSMITVLSILAGLVIGLVNYDYLSNLAETLLQTQVNELGYYGIMISVFLIELIPQPFLSAWIPFILGSILDLNGIYLILIIVITSIIANYTAYLFGLRYGDSMANFFVSEKNYEKSVKWFDKYGKKSIAILAFTPLPYFPVMGGIFKMTLKEFTIYAIIPRIFHFVIFLSIILIIT